MLDGLLHFLGTNSSSVSANTKKDININDLSDLKVSILSKPIVLLGMPGSGKTTIGRLLSQKLSFKFIDVDALIEEKLGKKIGQIFEDEGEQKFREIEKQIIFDLIEKNTTGKIIVSVGGGAVCNVETLNLLKTNTVSFFIDTHPEDLITRLETSHNKRPLLGTHKTKIINNVYKLYYDIVCSEKFLNRKLHLYK